MTKSDEYSVGQNKKLFKVGDLVRIYAPPNSINNLKAHEFIGETGIVLESDGLFKIAEVYLQVRMKTTWFQFNELILEE